MPSVPQVTADHFALQSAANLILPHESVDEAVRRYVLTVCSRALQETAHYRLWLHEATKRYEAMRSTRSLDRDDPGSPWPRASNVGLPLEAIVGEALIPRFNAATVDAEPIMRVSFPASAQQPQLATFEEDMTNWTHDLLKKKLRIRRVRDETYRNAVIDGDAIEELSWETVHRQTPKTVALLQNAAGEVITDASGQPAVFQANLPPQAIPDDPLVPGKKLKKLLVQQQGRGLLYDGPRIRPWRVVECLWPEDATTSDIQELDWFAVQMWKAPSWFKTREGDPIQGGLKNVEDVLLRLRHGIPSHLNTDAEQALTLGLSWPRVTHKVLVWRFFGQFDINRDGIDEEIVAMVAPRERVLLGWRLSQFAERPFSHFQLFKMPGRFTGRGLPHIGKGIRDITDFKINQANNRESLLGNPPLLYEVDSGFDPDLHQFGTGAKWGPLNAGGVNKIKALELPKSQEQLAVEFIQFYRQLLQELTGINQFNVGGAGIGSPGPNIKTATGQQLVTQEGNIKFADFIHDYQDTFERQLDFIDREFWRAGLGNERNLATLSDLPLPVELLRVPKRYQATGNSLTMNRQAMQEIALLLYDRLATDPVVQLDPVFQRQLRQGILDAFDVAWKLPSPEEIAKLMLLQIAQTQATHDDQATAKRTPPGRNGTPRPQPRR